METRYQNRRYNVSMTGFGPAAFRSGGGRSNPLGYIDKMNDGDVNPCTHVSSVLSAKH